MKGDCRRKLITVLKAAFFGFLGATAMVHSALLFMPVMRDFENRYFSERHTEFEIATLLIVGFLTLTMEPVFYIVELAVSLEKHGLVAFPWLAPVGITQSYACVKRAIQRKSDQ
jgi:undecaprenyl pyrophosphate phosphatase UppP